MLAERQARIDDLALLVELVSTGWRGIDTRLARIEAATHETTTNGHVERLPTEKPAAPADDEQHEPVERAAAA